MKKTVFLLVVSLISAADAQQFLSGFAAMPLMNGFRESADDLVFFKGDEGAIVEGKAFGEAPPEEALDYYRNLLPQLGWQPQGEEWLREGAVLTVTARRLDSSTVITFRLTDGGGD